MIERDFFPFEDSTYSDWLDQVKQDLKGKDFEKTLTSTVWDQIKIEPFYFKEKGKEDSHAILFNQPSPYPGQNPRIWSNLVSIYPEDEKTANQEILHVLENGAEGLVLHLTGTENLNQILKGVMTEYIQLYFNPIGEFKALTLQIQNWMESLHLRTDMLHGGIFWSPTSSLFMGKESMKNEIPNAVYLINHFKEFQNFYPVTIDFARYANAGGNGIQELTYGLGEMVEILVSLVDHGVSLSQALPHMAFLVSAGEQHFAEIAKLKALRILISELALNLGSHLAPDSFHFIVSTSLWTKSKIDQNSNLIRQTYEAMSGILGGANAIWVRPVNEVAASEREKRIARNVSIILREESYLDKIMDPATGSYFLDRLQQDIYEKVLAELEELEKAGGWDSNFRSGEIHAQIRSTRNTIQKLVLQGEKNMVGVNKYKHKADKVESLAPETLAEKDFELLPSRASYLVEIQNLSNS